MGCIDKTVTVINIENMGELDKVSPAASPAAPPSERLLMGRIGRRWVDGDAGRWRKAPPKLLFCYSLILRFLGHQTKIIGT